jgi:ribosomal protein L32
MRLFILLLLLFSSSLFAKKEESCYTVQLLSIPYSTKKSALDVPQECTLMHIANTITMRCGCYEKEKDAQKKLPSYQKKYKHAYIATSYKYRFKKKLQTDKFSLTQPAHATYTKDNEELKLMLQAFLYSNDLENAYKTAKIGYERHPYSLYWNQKMANICRWSGRSQEAMKYMRFLYNKKHNSKLAQEIIDYGLSAYQYDAIKGLVTEKALKNPTKTNVERMIYIYAQTGEPEIAAQTLHKLYLRTHKSYFLTKELQLYINMGEMDEAKRVVGLIEKNSLYTSENVTLISYYYYLKRDMSQAFAALNKTAVKRYDKQLLISRSDLGWYLQKYHYAAKTSYVLIKHNDGRLVDYERVIYVAKDTNTTLASQTALAAYEKYHRSYLFYTFANNAMKRHKYNTIAAIINKIDKEHAAITKEANYWLIKAQLAVHYNDRNKARFALQKALKLDRHNLQIQLTAIDLFLKAGFYDDAKETLHELAEKKNLPSALYLSVASLYYSLHDIDQAAFYIDELQKAEAAATKSLDFKFMLLELYRAQFKKPAVAHELRNIQTILTHEAKQNPEILKTDKYQYDYLRVRMYTAQADKFEKELAFGKKYLTQTHYDDLQYNWAVRNNADELAHTIYLQTNKRELWLELSNALMQQNHSTIEDLLFNYLQTLPIDDASYAAQNDGQTALSQSLTYSSLNTNHYDQSAYISWLNLTKKRSDLFDSKLSYYNRDPLLRKYIKIKNDTYINDGLYLLSNIEYYKNSTLDNSLLLYTSASSLGVDFGIRELFNRGKIELKGGYANSMESYYRFSLYGEYILHKYFTLKAKIAKNITADESIQLLLGGKKDMLSLGLVYNILNSTALELRYDKNKYTSQDNVAIGDGNYFTVNLGYQIRNGYPDMHVGIFSDGGIYSENSGSKGVIDKLQAGTYKVLPRDFYNLGANFSYGMQNSEIYTRVWRPYFEGSIYYNSEINNMTFGISAGYGGKVYSQDHLVIGTEYTNSVNGVGGSILEIFLRYEFLYTHR